MKLHKPRSRGACSIENFAVPLERRAMTMTSATMKIQSATKGPDLSKSVVLVRLEQHSFGNSRKLKQDQYEVDGGDKSMTSANRRLLDSEELQEIKSRMAAMREYVRNQSLPFPVDGVYM